MRTYYAVVQQWNNEIPQTMATSTSLVNIKKQLVNASKDIVESYTYDDNSEILRATELNFIFKACESASCFINIEVRTRLE